MRLSYTVATIGNGASLSNECDLRSFDLIGFEIPGTWTAAGISFKSCFANDGAGTVPQGGSGTLTETFQTVVDETGAEITVTSVATARYIGITTVMRDRLRALGRTKLVSGTNAVPVAQGQAVTLKLILCQTEG